MPRHTTQNRDEQVYSAAKSMADRVCAEDRNLDWFEVMKTYIFQLDAQYGGPCGQSR